MILALFGTYLAGVCLIIGSIFVVVGGIGLLKFKDPMTRLHAPTKVGTVGIGMLLVASVIQSAIDNQSSLHEFLILAFLFVTAPISANFIAKVHIHRRSSIPTPKPQRDDTWSTLKAPGDE